MLLNLPAMRFQDLEIVVRYPLGDVHDPVYPLTLELSTE